jgi:cytochrome c551/c552
MQLRSRHLAAAVSALLAAGASVAQEPADEKRIVAGAGAEVVAAKCGVCHDLSHITRSRLARGEWEDNLAMMVKRGMPPIAPAETAAILDYLTLHYGPKGPAAGARFFGDAVAGAPRDVNQLLAANACTGCHAVDTRVVGPSFREVAAKYSGLADVSPLVRKLREGSIGTWGQVPMPAMPQISAADAEALVRHVLATR